MDEPLPEPPTAKRVPFETPGRARPVNDDWFWLRHRDDPDTIAYLDAENAYAAAWFAQTGELQEAVFDEIRARTQETDLSVPVYYGGWWYLTRTVEGLAYPIHCRRRSENEGGADDEQVLLDENLLAEGHDYSELGVFDVSPSHGRLAWSIDHDGGEVYQMHVRDLTTGADLPDRISRTYYGSAWSADDAWLYYTVPDEAMRPHQVWRHRVGEPDESNDLLVFEEPDRRFNLSVSNTRSGAYVVIEAESRITSEAWVVAAADPTAPPTIVAPRVEGVEYSLDHQGDRFLIVTNRDAPDFRLVETPVWAPGAENWRDVLPHQPGTRVHHVAAFANHLTVFEWGGFLPRLRVISGEGNQRVLAFDEDVHSVRPHENPDYASSTLRFEYQSLVTPPTVIDEDVRTGERTERKQQPVLGGYAPTDYESSRAWATAQDGTKIPISLVHRRDVPRDGTAPLALYGYGSYEAALAPWFSVPRLSLLDRGVVWALAHVRGGGEGGRGWYLHGKLLEKRATFTDFIAAAEHLIAAGYTRPERLAIRGGSAGGLLVGAAVTMRPELFASVVAEVPFVDVVNTMLDATLPLTVEEWDEWGDPRDPVVEEYIASYSPYENTRTGRYPAMFVTAGLNDPRVSYHEPAKWVAKLRANCTDGGPVVFRCEMAAGHGGPTGRYEAWREEARVLAFLLRTLAVA